MKKEFYKDYKTLMLFFIVLSLSVISTGCMWSLNPLSRLTATTYEMDEMKSFSIDGLEHLDISVSVSELHILRTSNPEVQVSLKGSIRSNVPPQLIIDASGHSVSVRTHDRLTTHVNESRNSLVMTVMLPEQYDGNLDAGTVSGHIDISGFNLDQLTLATVSGDIHFADLTARSVKISSVSGAIKAEAVQGMTGRFSTTSGQILADVNPFESGLYISSISGDVDLKLPSDSDCGLEFSTVSGKFENGNAFLVEKIVNQNIKATKGTGKHSIKIVTTSGNLQIR